MTAQIVPTVWFGFEQYFTKLFLKIFFSLLSWVPLGVSVKGLVIIKGDGDCVCFPSLMVKICVNYYIQFVKSIVGCCFKN